MILSEQALKGNGDKLVKKFLSILESATSWFVNISYEAGSRESESNVKDSFIVSVTQPVSFSFACHVICKVKYFGKVANVKVRIPGVDNVLSFSQH